MAHVADVDFSVASQSGMGSFVDRVDDLFFDVVVADHFNLHVLDELGRALF